MSQHTDKSARFFLHFFEQTAGLKNPLLGFKNLKISPPHLIMKIHILPNIHVKVYIYLNIDPI